MKQFMLFLVLCTSFALANDFQPVNTGDLRTYTTDYNNDKLDVTVDARDGDWHQFSSYAGLSQQWVWSKDGSDNLYLWTGSTYERLVNTTDAVGTTYPIVTVPGADYAELSGRGVINTPAGSFNTVELSFHAINGRGPVTRSMVLAQGLGLYSWSYLNPVDGVSTYTLLRATINGVETDLSEPSQPEPIQAPTFQIIADFDISAARRPDCSLTESCELEPVTVKTQMILVNTSDVPASFIFNNGQYYDVEIINAEGEVALRWSDGQFFTQAFWTKTVAAGESWTFGDYVTFADRDGVHLPTGEYTLRMSMKSYSVSVPFSLQ